jgi:hypothetical protein
MNEQQNQPQKLDPDRKVVVWTFVQRCIERAGPDSRAADAHKLVRQQLRTATDEGGKE